MAATTLLALSIRADEGDLARLLAGVSEIAAPGVPGPLSVFGPAAFPVVVGRYEGGAQAPVVAAARWGKGRVVVFGHTGYFSAETFGVGGTGRLLANAVRWAADKPVASAAQISVGMSQNAALGNHLRGHGFAVRTELPADLKSVQVIALNAASLTEADLKRIGEFVSGGGGLLVNGLGWGWKQLNPGKDLLSDFAGNRLLAPAGIVWADGTLERTSAAGYQAGSAPNALTHAGKALQVALDLHAVMAKRPHFTFPNDPQTALDLRGGTTKLDPAKLSQVSATLGLAVQSLPDNETSLLFKIAELGLAVRVLPSAKEPLKSNDVLARLAASWQARQMKRLPVELMKAHPASDIFPGKVPAEAARVTRQLLIRTGVPDWHSTGLYAAPGEIVTVEISGSAIGQKLKVRVGAHADRNWHHKDWKRFPEISLQFPLTNAITRCANPFGGLIYVMVPEGAKPADIPVTIRGGVAAPYFVAGKTSLTDWRASIRQHPAPWAELQSDHIIITVPAEVVRHLDDPGALMTVWDRILDLDAELAARPLGRKRPERIVTDEQISAGYMHAGYPIMTLMDQTRNVVDAAHLRQGNWGLFHELGHNHQSRDWTFDGTGEVTCNLFTLYVFDKLCGTPPERHPRTSREGLLGHVRGYSFEKPDFAQWKQNPFLALTMYVQLQQAFGWEAFRKVFAEYQNLPDGRRPKSDAEKRDQWLVRFSRTINRNLGPFFQAWGVPVSAEALASVAGLPSWMPAGFPPKTP